MQPPHAETMQASWEHFPRHADLRCEWSTCPSGRPLKEQAVGGVITQPLTVALSGVAVGQVMDEANRARKVTRFEAGACIEG